MQLQMRVTGAIYGLFVIYTFKDMRIIKVDRNENFIANMMLKLTQFYEDCLVSEIIDSRYLRGLTIREPQYILDAKNEQEAKSENKCNSNSASNTNSKKSDAKNSESINKQCNNEDLNYYNEPNFEESINNEMSEDEWDLQNEEFNFNEYIMTENEWIAHEAQYIDYDSSDDERDLDCE